jgi:hypothetical protein
MNIAQNRSRARQVSTCARVKGSEKELYNILIESIYDEVLDSEENIYHKS